MLSALKKLQLRTYSRRLAGALLFLMTLTLTACGGDSAVSGPQLTSIAVGPPDASLVQGNTTSFTATGIYSNGQRQNLSASVTWSSTNQSIASISNTGVATAKAPGTATVTAALSGVSGTTPLTVTAPALVSVGVTPANLSVAVGLTHQFIATGIYSDNSSHDVTTSVVWSSSQTAVATVSNASGSNGLASTLGAGTSVITATANGVSGTVSLTVTAATLVSVGITPATLTLPVGVARQFRATGIYTDKSTHDLTYSVTWSSSAPTVASISNQAGSAGMVSASQVGTSTLTATLGTISSTAPLTVTAAALASIGLTPTNSSLAAGLNQQFTATGTYTDNSTHNLTTLVVWTSSATGVATISNAASYNGLVKAVTPGTTTITATLNGVAGSSTLTVTPATLVSIGVTPPATTIANGTALQFTATGTYTDNSTQNITTSVTWTSSAAAVASISNAAGFNGLATSAGVGASTITAISVGVSGTATLTVVSTTLLSMAITPANPSIADDGSQQFEAVATFADSSTQDVTAFATWTSATPAVATVSNAPGFNGLTSALTAGSTTITATLGSASGATTLTVSPALLQSIVITPVNPSIPDGNSQQFTATGTYSDGSVQNVTTTATWTSSDTTVATVGNAGSVGLATSLAVGSTTISAAVGSVAGTTTLTVTSVALVSLTIVPASTRTISGASVQFTAVGTYSNGFTANLTTAVTWSSSSSAAATLSNVAGSVGLATAVGTGTTTITASSGSITSTGATLTVGSYSRYVYTANNDDSTVSQFSEAGASLNALTPGTVTAGNGAQSIVVDPTGSYAYVANNNDNSVGTVSQFSVGTGGVLSPMNPATVQAGGGPQAIAVDPSGRYAYVVNNVDGTVSEFTIGTNGALSPMSPATVVTGNSPLSISIDPTGRFAYVVNESDATISQFLIGSGGVLTAASPSVVTTVSLPQGIAIDPTGRYAYVAGGGLGNIAQYAIGPSGQLSALSPANVAADSGPTAVAIDPTGRYVYVANQSGVIDQYTIGANGTLTPMSTPSVTAGDDPQAIGIDPAGQYVYIANEGDYTVTVFPIASGGALNATSPAVVTVGSGQSGPVSVATAY